MKNLKHSILKTVVGCVCVVLPWNKMHAQSQDIKKFDKETLCEFGASYTLKTSDNTYSFGGYINFGETLYAQSSKSKFHSCYNIYGGVGVRHFNTHTNKNRYLINCGAKFGVGYGPVSLMLCNGSDVSFDNTGNLLVTSVHGVGLYCTVAQYTKLCADIKWTVPVMAPTPTVQEYAERQKCVLSIGLIHVLSLKEYIK